MDELRFALALSAEEFLAFYEGIAKTVRVRAHDGRTLDLPAARLRPFVTREGIHGEFVLRLGAQNQVIELAARTGDRATPKKIDDRPSAPWPHLFRLSVAQPARRARFT
jgi:hypothetical protein